MKKKTTKQKKAAALFKKYWKAGRRHVLRTELLVAYVVLILIGGYMLVVNREHRDDSQITYGISFSTKYSKELGIDWRAAYLALLDDVQVKHIRVPVYWDEIQPEENGPLQLDDVQWMLDRAHEHDAKVILAVGERVPRWPECHPPAWAKEQWPADRQAAELKMLEQVVARFKDNAALDMWQVQNEPLFSTFGNCPLVSKQYIAQTVQLVRDIDNTHKIMMTDSGELSTWIGLTDITDVLGVSMYRMTWNKLFGYFYYTLPPEYYTWKARAIRPQVDRIMISELQTEPWPPGTSIIDTPLPAQYKSMNPKRLAHNIDYAQRTGINEIYLWGPEWWYWLKTKHNDSSMWDAGKVYFQ